MHARPVAHVGANPLSGGRIVGPRRTHQVHRVARNHVRHRHLANQALEAEDGGPIHTGGHVLHHAQDVPVDHHDLIAGVEVVEQEVEDKAVELCLREGIGYRGRAVPFHFQFPLSKCHFICMARQVRPMSALGKQWSCIQKIPVTT